MADVRGPSGRTPVIALGLAVTAVVVVGIALIVVATRSPARAVAGPVPAGPVLVDQPVRAADVVSLERAVDTQLLETVVEPGGPRGLRVIDAALAPALGVSRADVITAIAGRLVRRPFDVQAVVRDARRQRVTTLFVELERAGVPVVVRWRLDGPLRDAWLAAPQAAAPSAGVTALPDLHGIVQRDATHVEVPRALLTPLLGDPMAFARGMRMVPMMRNGVLAGVKVFAIRRGTLFAAIGLASGDAIMAINGEPLTEIDRVVPQLTAALAGALIRLEVDRRGQPQVIEIMLTP